MRSQLIAAVVLLISPMVLSACQGSRQESRPPHLRISIEEYDYKLINGVLPKLTLKGKVENDGGQPTFETELLIEIYDSSHTPAKLFDVEKKNLRALNAGETIPFTFERTSLPQFLAVDVKCPQYLYSVTGARHFHRDKSPVELAEENLERIRRENRLRY